MFTREFHLKAIFHTHDLDALPAKQIDSLFREVSNDVIKETESGATAKKFKGTSEVGNSGLQIEWELK